MTHPIVFSSFSRLKMKAAQCLGFGVASLAVASATLEPVVSGLTVSLPLLTGTAGSFTLPLAVLGVLKLAAAASLAGVNVLGGLTDLVPEVNSCHL